MAMASTLALVSGGHRSVNCGISWDVYFMYMYTYITDKSQEAHDRSL